MARHGARMSGRDLINAIVVGIETASRVNRCTKRIPHVDLSFHDPGLMGTFAPTASASRTLGLSPDAVVHALEHAGQQVASLMVTHHGGMGKRRLAGQAVRAGTFAALLAEHGFPNADNVFEAEYDGFCAAHTDNRHPPASDLTQLTKNLGSAYHTLGANGKMGACRVPNHAT
jgi:2-methylcitrate dehydratase PrpD